jgi:hypothetical protein
VYQKNDKYTSNANNELSDSNQPQWSYTYVYRTITREKGVDSFVASWWTTTNGYPCHTHTRIFLWRQTSYPFMRIKNVKKRGKHNIEKSRYKLQIYFRCWLYNFIDFAWLICTLQIRKKYLKKTKLLSQRPVDSCAFYVRSTDCSIPNKHFCVSWEGIYVCGNKLATAKWFVRK